jgi:hypothetical protein
LTCNGQSLSSARAREWESGAKSTLRAFGETQLAYQAKNNDLNYGSWKALVQTEYISEGYTRANIIENYFLWTAAFSPPRMSSGSDGSDCTFTAVAFPRITRPPGYLSTFAIREDQVLRVYRPAVGANVWGQNGDFGTRTWEPVR